MKKIFNVYTILNIVLVIAVLVGDVFYMLESELWIKALTSLGFVGLGILNVIYAKNHKSDKDKFIALMLIGLTFAMLGDIFLNIYFISGAVLFAIGHVFYFLAYCSLKKFKWTDLIAGALIFIPATLFITLAPIFNFDSIVMELVCIFYALVISCMVGKSITNLIRERSLLNLIVFIGSFLFMFSDIMLLINVFAQSSQVFGALCLGTYYPANCILAIAIALSSKKQSK